ncbi:MAG: hypothetical protein IH945_09540 [Armatimonadetes bacterium]|nr:hypothetical protein [Armatimonadota bacterium]
MEGQPDQELRRKVKTFPILCLAFIVMIALMVIFVRPPIESGQSALILAPVVVVGFASLLSGVVYARIKLAPRKVGGDVNELPPPARFMFKMLNSLFQIEFCALLGEFVVQDPTLSLVMPIAAIAAIALGVLPHVLHYVKVANR